jgi:hypothetical protein
MLPANLGPLCLQLLLLLLEAHDPMQVDPRDSTALWTTDDSSLQALLPYRYPQLATQCQELATTHLSELQAQALLFCWCQEASHLTEHGGPALPIVSDNWKLLLPHQSERMPDSPLRTGKS